MNTYSEDLDQRFSEFSMRCKTAARPRGDARRPADQRPNDTFEDVYNRTRERSIRQAARNEILRPFRLLSPPSLLGISFLLMCFITTFMLS